MYTEPKRIRFVYVLRVFEVIRSAMSGCWPIWPKFSVAGRFLVYIDGPNTILTKNLFLAVLDAQKVTENGRFCCFWPFLAVFGRF